MTEDVERALAAVAAARRAGVLDPEDVETVELEPDGAHIRLRPDAQWPDALPGSPA